MRLDQRTGEAVVLGEGVHEPPWLDHLRVAGDVVSAHRRRQVDCAEDRARVIKEYGADSGLVQTIARLADYVAATVSLERGS